MMDYGDNLKFSDESLLFAEDHVRNAPFPPRLDLALPAIRFPTKHGIVDNLPDWKLSAESVYYLQRYMAPDVEQVDVTLVPDSPKILYDQKPRQFRYCGGSGEWFHAIAYVNVIANGVSDCAVLLAYTTELSTSLATTADCAAAAPQIRDTKYRVGIDLGTVISHSCPLLQVYKNLGYSS